MNFSLTLTTYLSETYPALKVKCRREPVNQFLVKINGQMPAFLSGKYLRLKNLFIEVFTPLKCWL